MQSVHVVCTHQCARATCLSQPLPVQTLSDAQTQLPNPSLESVADNAVHVGMHLQSLQEEGFHHAIVATLLSHSIVVVSISTHFWSAAQTQLPFTSAATPRGHDAVGDELGDPVGDVLGRDEGDVLGLVDGLADGLAEGDVLGDADGDELGLADGDELGLAEGEVLGVA